MNAIEILQSIINDFDLEKFKQFFRSKNGKLKFFNKEETIINIDEFGIKDYSDTFKEGWKIAEGELEDGELVVFSFLVNKKLSERSTKKTQYELGKKILKQDQKDAGIFIFYDNQGNFRLSLIYANYLGTHREWSSFKRFTYFVSKKQSNKTFLKQIGEADFSTLEKIKESFSVEPVTKQFYSEIQNWYFWAMDKIKFPDDYKYSNDPTKDKEIRNAVNLIRLITRLIFIWFIKEKGLVPADLFSKEKLKDVVKEFMVDVRSSNYYNAILQNLFFGTLNQKMNERKFADEYDYLKNRKEYGVKNLFRYADKFLISKEKVLELFKDIPFLNGGLFDCLDKEDETGKVIYIDGFSRNPSKQAIIPDYLFFMEKEEKVDLSKYDVGENKPVRGIIEILNSYNFIIDENTPIDQEVALDPELLGKIFENLLASYNPETATTARKATGSYYTPREIVDYMVEESLFEYLKTKLPEIDEIKIKTLLSYSDEIPNFTNEEKGKIISAIDEIKIIDPACGSGAFPMGILHKLVYTLQKLDPENKLWFELQYQKALKETEEVFKQGDKNQREERLKEINEAFDEKINYPDYARKLYLIENCIYGVDIQPIAMQISKLRFFISLVLDQKVDKTKENFGIRALPNLETNFVAANTLIGLEKTNHLFYTKEIKQIEDKIKSLRHKYFTAKTRREKLDYQKKDKELRENLAQELKKVGFSLDASEKISKFDLYDQNASADWFDPEWMFGVKDGFDIVIGNPPYIQLQKAFNSKIKYADIYKDQNYQTFERTGDIYCLFYEKGIQLLNENGHLCYITSNKWMRAGYGESLRKFFLQYNPKILIDLGPNVFENATVDTNILLIAKQKNQNKLLAVSVTEKKKETIDFSSIVKEKAVILNKLTKDAWFIGSNAEQQLKEKIESIGKPLKDWDVKIYYGIKTGLNEAFIITTEKRNEILANCQT
ncbi:MAG: Eco57I restriction-modification methylase domain-containing protein, partial [Caldisericia bacterium]